MRGGDQQHSGMFSYVSLEERVPQDHPLRAIRKLVDEILRGHGQGVRQHVRQNEPALGST